MLYRGLTLLAASVMLAGCLSSGSSSRSDSTPPPVGGDGPVSDSTAASLQRLEIIDRYPAYGGQSFGNVGTYEVINARAHFLIDPEAGTNERVVDLEHAPRNAEGYVEYSSDVVILRPTEADNAKRVLIYDAPNRGAKVINRLANDGSIDSDLRTAAEAGNGFLMRQGYTLVWNGWQPDTGNLPAAALKAYLPVATTPEGPIVGDVHAEFVFNNTTSPATIRLEYPVVEQDQANLTLTVRQRTDDLPTLIPSSAWSFTNDRTISVERPAGFDAGAIYQVVYKAKDPVVAGLGMTATRDLIGFLRYETSDAAGNQNPLLDLRDAPCERNNASQCRDEDAHIETAIGMGVSQSSRYLRDFLWQGFNSTVDDRIVFDGMLPFIAGSRKSFTNARFAMPDRFSRQHEEALVPGNQFPFHYPTQTDPLTGQVGGLLDDCSARQHCPRIIHMDNSSEFWQAGAGLVGTDGAGSDVAQPGNVRLYHIAGAPHITTPAGGSYCKYPGTQLNYRAMTRSLLTNLVDWVGDRSAPPASVWPTLANNQLAPATDQSAVGFPDLRALGVEYSDLANPVRVADYNQAPPEAGASAYTTYVPVTDTDGNELSGVRLPDVAVPLGTYLGWNVRAAGFAEDELCFLFGSFVPFARTEAERIASGDPRPSLETRYADKADYVAKVRAAAEDLAVRGLILPEDVNRYAAIAGNTTAFD